MTRTACDHETIPRFGRTERLLHWTHASAFLLLLATGLALYLPDLAELVGRRPLLKAVHLWTAVAWVVAVVLVLALGDRRREFSPQHRLEFSLRYERRHRSRVAGKLSRAEIGRAQDRTSL